MSLKVHMYMYMCTSIYIYLYDKPTGGVVCKTCVFFSVVFFYFLLYVYFLQVGTGHRCVGVLFLGFSEMLVILISFLL